MTHQLTYSDPRCRSFTARVIGRDVLEDGEGVRRPAAALDQTAFYPTSGGQPYDTGVLAGIPVVDVQKAEDGTIWHLLEQALPTDIAEVSGEIDWARRFDHMQQHTGQHILSAVFEDLLGGRTIGFHLGRESSTIDLDLKTLSWEDVFRVEDCVNQVIWKSIPVDAEIFPREEALKFPLRKPPEVAGDVRLVLIQGVDICACGGTHVRLTGDIGSLKVTAVAGYKGGVRVTFLCGRRALVHHQRSLQLLQTASRALSVGTSELPDAVARLQDELKAGRRDLRKTRDELAVHEVEALWRDAPVREGVRTISRHWSDKSFAEARSLASGLRERPGTLVLLAVTEPNGVRIVCARSDDLNEINANTLLREALGALGGRGGGPPTMAQGGAPVHPPDAVLAALEQALATLHTAIA